MKELSMEEKAERYDKALERMKSWVRGEHPECFTEAQKAAEFIFPELKESEDENVRKEIISHLQFLAKYCIESMPNVDKWIAWLEKQGKKKPFDYTHTNVFTEKAAIWFNNNFIVHDEYGVISDSFDTKEEMFEDFKNYMKEE